MDFWGLFDSQNSWENRSINKLVFNNAVAWAQYELLAPRLWALGEVRQLMEKCWFYSIQIETFWRVDQNRRVRICMWESSPLMRKTRKRKAYCSTNWSHIQLMTTGCRCVAWWRQEKPEVILRKQVTAWLKCDTADSQGIKVCMQSRTCSKRNYWNL